MNSSINTGPYDLDQVTPKTIQIMYHVHNKSNHPMKYEDSRTKWPKSNLRPLWPWPLSQWPPTTPFQMLIIHSIDSRLYGTPDIEQKATCNKKTDRLGKNTTFPPSLENHNSTLVSNINELVSDKVLLSDMFSVFETCKNQH